MPTWRVTSLRNLSELKMISGMDGFVRSSACLRVLRSFEIPLRTRKHALLQAKILKSGRQVYACSIDAQASGMRPKSAFHKQF
ncbi:MAG TPA: hypothetical protein DET40_21925 [Lentisphaeria bacterium]|nr:MAG: hypothetical protein A2X45_04020 [Lentisphaerae bacterium GWF2_50_93]HCE46213.1 hypothetical protein [Lentisphaeria bacterium]